MVMPLRTSYTSKLVCTAATAFATTVISFSCCCRCSYSWLIAFPVANNNNNIFGGVRVLSSSAGKNKNKHRHDNSFESITARSSSSSRTRSRPEGGGTFFPSSSIIKSWELSAATTTKEGGKSLSSFSSSPTKATGSNINVVHNDDDDSEEEDHDRDHDRSYLNKAVELAKFGLGRTYPNPAVGCVIVRQDTGDVLGKGFHPKAGYPHAEVFALLEAAGHIDCGVDAAKSVIVNTDNNNNIITRSSNDSNNSSNNNLQRLMDIYTGGSVENNSDSNDNNNNDSNDSGDVDVDDGPRILFGDCFADVPYNVTAYVTLEPCCHYGKTPPCAASLVLARVDRVVIGYQDPNPRVDGGGCKVLKDAGIDVDLMNDDGCAKIVDSFIKRIRPKDYDDQNYSHVTGSHRRLLRRIAGRKKSDGTLKQVSWNWNNGKAKTIKNEEDIHDLTLPAEWMEALDNYLWTNEIVNVRLNKVVSKKKFAKILGEKIATNLGAHVAQNVGHTCLLYRPGSPKSKIILDDDFEQNV